METKTTDYGGIGWAVNLLRHGHPLRRAGWPTSMRLIYVPEEVSNLPHKFAGGSKMTAYMALVLGDGSSTPWHPTNDDVLATDWLMVEPVQPGESHALDVPVA